MAVQAYAPAAKRQVHLGMPGRVSAMRVQSDTATCNRWAARVGEKSRRGNRTGTAGPIRRPRCLRRLRPPRLCGQRQTKTRSRLRRLASEPSAQRGRPGGSPPARPASREHHGPEGCLSPCTCGLAETRQHLPRARTAVRRLRHQNDWVAAVAYPPGNQHQGMPCRRVEYQSATVL